jgi:hypothetical protein
MLEQVLQLSNYAETLIITNGTESLNLSIAVTNMWISFFHLLQLAAYNFQQLNIMSCARLVALAAKIKMQSFLR